MVETIGIAIIAAGVIAFGALFRGFLSSAHKTCVALRRRGYSQILSATLPILVCLVSMFGPLILNSYFPSLVDDTLMVELTGSLMVVGTLINVLLRRVPQADHLRSPAWNRPVTPPFAILAVCVGILAVVVPLKMLMDTLALGFEKERLENIGTIFIGLAGVALFMYEGHRRSRLATVTAAMQNDPRPPVLYLRAFAAERKPFTMLKGKDGRKLITSIPDKLQLGWLRIRFEEYFAPSIGRTIGPFVALGAPGEFLPQYGASREYQPNAEWQRRLVEVAESAQAIVVQCGESQSLNWEFEMLLEKRLSERLFVMTPPTTAYVKKRWAIGVSQKYDLAAATAAAWQSFSSCITGAGYSVPSGTPPPGSVLLFDQSGTARIVSSGAATPDDYVRAMHAALTGMWRQSVT